MHEVPDFTGLDQHTDPLVTAQEVIGAVMRRYATLVSEALETEPRDEQHLASLIEARQAAVYDHGRLPSLDDYELRATADAYLARYRKLTSA